MVVGVDEGFYALYPVEAGHDTSAPYIRWPGTPYRHPMAPVE